MDLGPCGPIGLGKIDAADDFYLRLPIGQGVGDSGGPLPAFGNDQIDQADEDSRMIFTVHSSNSE